MCQVNNKAFLLDDMWAMDAVNGESVKLWCTGIEVNSIKQNWHGVQSSEMSCKHSEIGNKELKE